MMRKGFSHSKKNNPSLILHLKCDRRLKLKATILPEIEVLRFTPHSPLLYFKFRDILNNREWVSSCRCINDIQKCSANMNGNWYECMCADCFLYILSKYKKNEYLLWYFIKNNIKLFFPYAMYKFSINL